MATVKCYETADKDLATKAALEFRIEVLRKTIQNGKDVAKNIKRIKLCQNRLETEFNVAKAPIVPEIKGIHVGTQLTDADTFDTSKKLWGDCRKSILATAI